MRVQSLIDVLERIAPLAYAEAWDNVGLLIGDREQSWKRALLTIDYTAAVAQEAKRKSCEVVIAYHPPIFDALKNITAGGTGDLIHDAIRQGIAIYSPHTALDASGGGTNDVLAEVIGLTECQALRLSEGKSTQYKLVVFVPEAQIDAVADAMFSAGAGQIGKYSSCSFRSAGTGTFFGKAGTNPAVGKSGRLETAAEIRLETVVPIAKLEAVITALRKSHPYEEPAFDLNQLTAEPTGIGQGRIGTFIEPVKMSELVNRVKRGLKIGSVLVSGDLSKVVRTIAICAGAGGGLLDDAIGRGADLYFTGELRHHEALKAARAGVATICTLHSNSERPVLGRLKARLEEKLAGAEILISEVDCDPFSIQ